MATKELEQQMQQVSDNLKMLRALTVAAEKFGPIPSEPEELDKAFMATYGHREEEIVGMLRGNGDRAAIASVCTKIVMNLTDQEPATRFGVAGA